MKKLKWSIVIKKAAMGAAEGAAMVLAGGVVIGQTPNWLGIIAGAIILGAWRGGSNAYKHR